MRSLVVLFALASVACGSLIPLAQPPHHPALVLDPHGRPLDTAEVINARALHLQAKALEGHYTPLLHSAVAPLAHSVVAPAVVAHALPSAVSHQSRVDVHSSPAVVSTYAAAPIYGAHSYGYGLSAHGHNLKKRSLALAHVAYSAPSAVSHQSRVDVISSPAVVPHAVAAPVYAHAAYAAPVYAHVAPSAVSHQSRVDVHSSPAVVSTYAAAPLVSYASPLFGAHSYGHGLSAHGHYLKKRSLALGHIAYSVPSAVSHQSRVDVHSSPAIVSHAVAAPVYAHAAPVYAHAAPVVAHVAPAAVSHQSRVDVRSSPAVVAHSYVAAPILHSAPLSYSSSLLHSNPLAHAW